VGSVGTPLLDSYRPSGSVQSDLSLVRAEKVSLTMPEKLKMFCLGERSCWKVLSPTLELGYEAAGTSQ
jgi:hypothetical protein